MTPRQRRGVIVLALEILGAIALIVGASLIEQAFGWLMGGVLAILLALAIERGE